MIIDIETLTEFCSLISSNEIDAERFILSTLKALDILIDDSYYYAMTIEEAIKEIGNDPEKIATGIFGYNLKDQNPDAQKKFNQLILKGDGECPYCGGEMLHQYGALVLTGGFGYDSEPEYTPKWERRECKICGHFDSNEQQTD